MRRLLGMLALVTVTMLSVVPLAGAVGERATGAIVDGAGNSIGAVEMVETASGVRLTVTLQGAGVVKPGLHGIHLHAVGKCEGPGFTSAGGHFNPAGKKHGAKNPEGAHAGDLPNLPIDASTATQSGYQWTTTTNLITLAPGPASLFDADGTALIIHADPDDEITDPTGNSGNRVACAVITQTMPGLPNTGSGGGARWQSVILASGTLALLSAVLFLGLRGVRRHA